MSYIKDVTMKVSAADGTTATLVPVATAGPQTPSQIVVTFAATPVEFTAGKPVRVRIETTH
jgi:hypothetical protein